MPEETPQPGQSDSLNQPDMDQLMEDIQRFLRDDPGDAEALADDQALAERRSAGRFFPAKDPDTMAAIGRFALRASYLVEGLTILSLIGVLTLTWSTWLHLGLALVGILTAGLVCSFLLLGVYARINLLVDIEANTRRIATNKAKIAALLERVWIV